MKITGKRDLGRWLWVLPAILVVVCLFVYPLSSQIFYSFTNKTLIRPAYSFKGLDNYKSILADPSFWKALWTSVKWTVLSLVFQLLVGFTAALALNKVENRVTKQIYRILLVIPWAFPTIAIAIIWKWLLNGIYGFIPSLMVKLGMCRALPQFLSNPDTVLITLVVINVWFGFPLIMVNVLAALQTVPMEQYEAAEIDGANSWHLFAFITLPHIRNVIGLLVVLRTIWVFNSFDIIFMITGGGPANATTTLPIYIYNLGWTRKFVGKESAVAVILLMILLAICMAYFRVLRRWEKEESV
jgi:multiple sugar transport system permease protein